MLYEKKSHDSLISPIGHESFPRHGGFHDTSNADD
jgi:hypothetical protein